MDPTEGRAQSTHSDVFFTYGDTKIEIAPQDGRLVIPEEFRTSGFFSQFNNNPGFFSESDLGGGTGPEDQLAYNVLDDLFFWSEGEFVPAVPGSYIRIDHKGDVDDTVIGLATGEQPASFDPPRNLIGRAKNGEFHAHVNFFLEPTSEVPEEMPAPGAYGLKLSLSTDNAAVQQSDPFFVVYQFGIEDADFTQALDDFDALLTPDTVLLGTSTKTAWSPHWTSTSSVPKC